MENLPSSLGQPAGCRMCMCMLLCKCIRNVYVHTNAAPLLHTPPAHFVPLSPTRSLLDLPRPSLAEPGPAPASAARTQRKQTPPLAPSRVRSKPPRCMLLYGCRQADPTCQRRKTADARSPPFSFRRLPPVFFSVRRLLPPFSAVLLRRKPRLPDADAAALKESSDACAVTKTPSGEPNSQTPRAASSCCFSVRLRHDESTDPHQKPRAPRCDSRHVATSPAP